MSEQTDFPRTASRAGFDLESDAGAALEALRDVAGHGDHAWHPALVGAAARLLMDWLTDTGQGDALADLHDIEVVSPHTMADTVRLGDIGDAESRASASLRTHVAG